MKKQHFICFFLFIIASFFIFTKSGNAQVSYEDVVEKIRYTHIGRLVGLSPSEMVQYDAKKEMGSINPILKVYIWGDLSTVFTKKFFDEIFPILKNKYSTEALFIYNHRAYLSQDISIKAGIIAECTAIQDQFWENISPITSHLDNLDSLDYLQSVDKTKIEECVKNPRIKSIIEESEADGKYLGFNAIPTIVIQNITKPQQYAIKVTGAQDISIFERAFIEARDGDLSKKELQEIKVTVTQLQQDTNQIKHDVKELKTNQSFLSQEIEKLKMLIDSILKQMKYFFNK